MRPPNASDQLTATRPRRRGIRLLSGLLAICVCSTSSAQSPSTTAEPELDPHARDHWSFRRLQRPRLPDVRDRSWPRNPIDRFILSRMESAGLVPLPAADPGTLIRRVTFDLTGLPPTPKEIAAYATDPRPDAYRRLVDRLLASDAYGQRWAQHWLDLARFAETDGFEFDKIRPNAWRYRDWVIGALNADMPFNRFVQLQLAGDEIAPDQPAAHIATGFLLCGPDMPDINLQTERRYNVLNEMTSTVGSVLLGLQVGCAQCHDHKFDPISHLDFYRLRAFFDNADLFREHPIATSAQRLQVRQSQQKTAARWQQAQQQLASLHKRVRDRLTLDGRDVSSIADRQLTALMTPKERQDHTQLTQQWNRIKQRKPLELPMGRVMRQRPDDAGQSFSYIRGDFRRKGPAVQAAFLRIINPDNQTVQAVDSKSPKAGQRSQLARWITRPDNPLLTRVIVNRIWQHHFSHGLSPTDSDFGVMGDEPTHPLLLDWLANELPDRNWSLKQLHRLLVTSATYRQCSRPTGVGWSENRILQIRDRWNKNMDIDPQNQMLWRMTRRRLEGEAIRDSLLFVSGQLNHRRGGPGIRPPLPPEQVATLLKNQWPVTADTRDHSRRSIYLFVRRNLRFPILDAFDKPDTNTSCGRRNRSTTAPQALMLLNARSSLVAAQQLARRIADASTQPADQITACYVAALGRPPSPVEQRLALRFLTGPRPQDKLAVRSTGGDEQSPTKLEHSTRQLETHRLTQLGLTLFNLNEFIYID